MTNFITKIKVWECQDAKSEFSMIQICDKEVHEYSSVEVGRVD